jgi:MOSC domain-containing protein YiiM
MRLVAVRTGAAHFRESPRGEWRSAIEKHRISSPVHVTTEGIFGDEQADRQNHGGPEKAILAYSADHYPAWQTELGLSEFAPGALGENLEITGQSEPDVCVGDTYRLSGIIVQVSQPRQPCWKPAWLNGIPDLTKRIALSGRTGWYLRVLQEGQLEFPCDVELLERPHPAWTVDRANRLLYHKAEGQSARLELADLPELSLAWRDMLRYVG